MTTKVCTKCGEEKALDSFPPDKTRPQGRKATCRVCLRKRLSAWRRATSSPEQREKRRLISAQWREDNREKNLALQAAYRAENKEKYREWAKANYRKDIPRARARDVARRALKLKATVAWADPAKIREKYAEARALTVAFGEPFHVDHIIPLVSEHVCGLHWEDNLQVIPAIQNYAKKNKLLPQHVTF